ncbi:MAG: PspC domain-containing protein [Niabella sp.]
MKTIINITLGGRSIAIEDTAYEKIKTYTEELKLYYQYEDGCDEIIADIESRFSELMYDKIRMGAAHITDEDAEEMIHTMGRPEDFDNEAKTNTTTGSDETHKRGGRLYRDESNKVLGGVCSGIANWLHIDPTVVRVLFAIISFGGFGSGFLIYIFLWIFLPSKNMRIYNGKRMFRNPNDKIIGGVAGGMGAYFNINPNTIRWVLAIPLILSILKSVHFFGWDDDLNIFPNLFFGGLTGTFVFIYLILWIVLPEANTPYQKMEMHGQAVDISSIKENVQNSMGDIKDRMQNWGQEVKEAGDRIGQKVNTFSQQRGPEFGKEFGSVAAKGGKGIGYIIAMIFKAFFVFVAGTIAISLFVVFLAFIFSGFAWAPVNNFLWTSDNQQMWAWGTLLFFVGAPIIGLLVSLIRMILSIRTPGNYLNWMFGGLWTVGWVCLTMFIASLSKDMKRVEFIEAPVNISQPINGKMLLTVSQPMLEFKNKDYGWINTDSDFRGFSISSDTLKLSVVDIDIEKSTDSLYHVIIKKEAFGKTDEDARKRVNKLQYNIYSNDSILDLQNGFAIDKNSKYRFQNITVIIQVPVGKKIQLDASVNEKLNIGKISFTNYKDTRNSGWKSNTNISHLRANKDYTMDSSGRLASINNDKKIDEDNSSAKNILDTTENNILSPEEQPNTEVYRYNATPTAPKVPAAPSGKSKEDLQKQIEQKQKEVELLKKELQQ